MRVLPLLAVAALAASPARGTGAAVPPVASPGEVVGAPACGVDAAPLPSASPPDIVRIDSTARLDISGRIVALGLDLTQPPAPRADVTVTAEGTSATTGGDGLFALAGVAGTVTVRIVAAPDGAFYPMEIPASQVSGDILLMERGSTVLQQGRLEGGREMLVEARDQFEARVYPMVVSTAFVNTPPRYRWASYPVAVYVPPCVDCTSDLPGATREAIARWNQAMDTPILVEVPAPPAVGITVAYMPMTTNIGTTVVTEPLGTYVGDAIPVKVQVQLKRDGNAEFMRLVVFHEFGHALMQRHSPDRGHLMHSVLTAPQRTWLHPDEVLWTSFIRFMPQGTDPDWYVLQ